MLDKILSSGGDRRILLRERDHLNEYACSPFPVDHLAYASSTASTIGVDAYAWVESLYRRMNRGADPGLGEAFQSVRDRLRAYLGLDDTTDIALGPSGTDMELLALACVANVHREIANVVVASDEVGTGLARAAMGRHWSDITPSDEHVCAGDAIKGFESLDIDAQEVPIRDEGTGNLLSEREVSQKLRDNVDKSVRCGRRVLIHLVYRTKTGAIAPNPDVLENLTEEYRGSIDVVVDACQFRMCPQVLREFLSRNWMVILTGSKFYQGAPFSAALLLPAGVRERFSNGGAPPAGLSMYFSRAELPYRWCDFDRILDKRENIGLLLRWESALFEMREYGSIDVNRIRDTIRAFYEVLQNRIERSPVCSLVVPQPLPLAGWSWATEEGDEEIIQTERAYGISICTLIVSDTEQELSLDDAYTIYWGLYTDLSAAIPEDLQEEATTLSTICHVGQPVKMVRNAKGEWAATLRISLSARFISDHSGKVMAEQKRLLGRELGTIVRKVELIVSNISRVREEKTIRQRVVGNDRVGGSP